MDPVLLTTIACDRTWRHRLEPLLYITRESFRTPCTFSHHGAMSKRIIVTFEEQGYFHNNAPSK